MIDIISGRKKRDVDIENLILLFIWKKANQREESYKEQIKTLTTKLKQVRVFDGMQIC